MADTHFLLNGAEVTAQGSPDRLLLDVLREDFHLHGPKYGCGLAQCGACSVLVDGQAARACVLRVGRVAGRQVVTLEGLAATDGTLHPVQQAFVDAQGAQCGYCLNGMVISTVALLATNPTPSPEDIRQGLRDTLCRCGTHKEIAASVARAAVLMGDTK